MSELPTQGSMDDLESPEIKLAMLAQGGPSLGHVVMQSIEGDIVSSSSITYDHQEVGALLNSDTGSAKVEELLYADLDDDQKELRRKMNQWAENPDIDFI